MNNNGLDIDVLEDYLNGKLDAKAMNRVEREALEDPFVAEALAGLSASPRRSVESISLLQKQLSERIGMQQATKKTSVITWQRLSIASTAAVLFVAVSIMFWMREDNRRKQFAGQPKKVEVTIAPKEFKDSVVRSTEAMATVDVKTPVAIDKAIAAAKTNTYAANVKAKKETTKAPEVRSQRLDEVTVTPSPLQEKISAAIAAPASRIARADTTSSLNEAEVAGYGTAEKKQAKLVSEPVGGWDNLFGYISKNNKFNDEPKTGKSVELTFNINKDGSPVNIKVVKGIISKYDDEAVRLILKGPKWELPENDTSKITFKIDF